jgi:glycosyltransferase involved in cell wall biosynthesis
VIAAVGMVRDEADIISFTLGQLFAEGIDHIWVADNLSTDGTRDLLEGWGSSLTVLEDPEPGYYQSEKMTRLGKVAGEAGADWVLPFDADEYWYGDGYSIAEILNYLKGVDVAVSFGYDHLPRHEMEVGADPVRRMPWRRPNTQRFPKVAYRYHPDAVLHYGNHDVDHPGHREWNVLAYRHFGYRSPEQLIRKVRNGKAALDASDIHPMYGAHWRTMGALSDEELLGEWKRLCDEDGLVYDPAPTP